MRSANSKKQARLHDLREAKKWGRSKKDRIFIAGSYEPERLGILEAMAHWIDQLEGSNFHPILLKDFQTFENVGPQDEPPWFKSYKTRRLPLIGTRLKKEGVVIGRDWEQRPREWKNLMTSTLYLLDQCSFVFFELTSPGFGTVKELIITFLVYRTTFLFHFVELGKCVPADFEPLVDKKNLFYYRNSEHLREVVESCLRTLAILKKSL